MCLKSVIKTPEPYQLTCLMPVLLILNTIILWIVYFISDLEYAIGHRVRFPKPKSKFRNDKIQASEFQQAKKFQLVNISTGK